MWHAALIKHNIKHKVACIHACIHTRWYPLACMHACSELARQMLSEHVHEHVVICIHSLSHIKTTIHTHTKNWRDGCRVLMSMRRRQRVSGSYRGRVRGRQHSHGASVHRTEHRAHQPSAVAVASGACGGVIRMGTTARRHATRRCFIYPGHEFCKRHELVFFPASHFAVCLLLLLLLLLLLVLLLQLLVARWVSARLL